MAGSRQSLRLVPEDGFAARLGEKRRADDLTQTELGERLGVSQQTIGAWERGDRPQSKMFAKLIDYLELGHEQALTELLSVTAETRERSVSFELVVPTTDGEAMRLVTARIASGRLTADEVRLYESLIDYYKSRLGA